MLGALACLACVTPTADALPRARASIVGGSDASISSLPFVVALYDLHAGSPAAGFFCGGVILDATHVATAAHCVTAWRGGATQPETMAVLAGSSSLEQPQPGSVIDPVRSSSFDARYRPSTSDYDVALLTLARPLWVGPTAPALDGVNAIAPLAPDARMAGAYGNPNISRTGLVTTAGWGDVNPAPGHAPGYPMTLRSVRMPLVPDSLCEEEYALIEQPITARMICAGGDQTHRDSCYGDSGGPLLADADSPAHPPQDYVLVGLVDFGNGCALGGYAGVYTRIANPDIVGFLTSAAGHRARPVGSQARHRKKRKKRRHR